jgi:hypothetical protein
MIWCERSLAAFVPRKQAAGKQKVGCGCGKNVGRRLTAKTAARGAHALTAHFGVDLKKHVNRTWHAI